MRNSGLKERLLEREDIFADYTREAFEEEFSRFFVIEDSIDVQESQRTLYLMRRAAT